MGKYIKQPFKINFTYNLKTVKGRRLYAKNYRKLYYNYNKTNVMLDVAIRNKKVYKYKHQIAYVENYRKNNLVLFRMYSQFNYYYRKDKKK